MTKISVFDGTILKAEYSRVISASLTDSLNGECTFEFSVTSEMANGITTGFEVQVKSGTLDYVFNIARIAKSISGGLTICTVTCEHKSYELNNEQFKLSKFEFSGEPSKCLDLLLEGTSLTAGICEPQIPIELKINQECSRRAALMQLIVLCGGEIEYSGECINIRSHRGSEQYREIMDGKNISDLTLDIDSRSGTASYGLTLYKSLDFGIGDNIHIVFHPFDLDVFTRIISVSYSPFDRHDVSITVGDYAPSINDNLYKIEKTANEIKENVSDSTAEIKTAVNSTDISISEKVQRIFRISYNALRSTYAAFCSTVKFTLSSVGKVVFILKKDENEVMRYIEDFDHTGDFARTYTYPFTSKDGQNTISLNVISETAHGIFPKIQSWGYVMGAYLAGDSPWDGYIEVRTDDVHFVKRGFGSKNKFIGTERILCALLPRKYFELSETLPVFHARSWSAKCIGKSIREILPNVWEPIITTPPSIKVVNTSNRDLYFELRNPVSVNDEINAAAFSLIITTASGTVTIMPVSADFETGCFGSTINLHFDNSKMRETVQAITLLYDGGIGNLHDVMNDIPCGNFQTSFIYIPYEEEQDDQG
ncbi:MAG: hypothetical protein HDT42_13635 [Ruminococcaceae bacterium]|nr:hypothetical protein [Oscillospiraceae bacterium]